MDNKNRISHNSHFIDDALCLWVRGEGVISLTHYAVSHSVSIHNLTHDDCLYIADLCLERALEIENVKTLEEGKGE